MTDAANPIIRTLGVVLPSLAQRQVSSTLSRGRERLICHMRLDEARRGLRRRRAIEYNHRMRIVFWNTGKRPVADLLSDLSRLRDVDVFILAEVADPVGDVVSGLNRGAKRTYASAQERLVKSVKRPLHMLTRLPEGRVEALRDSAGVAVKRVFPVIGLDFIIVAVHLRSKLFQDPEDQASEAMSINRDIEAIEDQVGHHRTLVIGDFNMNPFERGLVSFDCFHAVMSRNIARRRSRKIGGHERHFFYNPMWNHFGDRPPSPPGSYYRRGSGLTEYFWHMFDQVLLRPDLLDYFPDHGPEVLTRIGRRSLLSHDGIPSARAGSDHLPLFLELSIERGAFHGRTESVAQAEG